MPGGGRALHALLEKAGLRLEVGGGPLTGQMPGSS